MLIRMTVYEEGDRARLERGVALARLALGRHGLRDARLQPLSLGFKEVYLVESPARGRFVLRTYAAPPEGEGGSDPRFLKEREAGAG